MTSEARRSPARVSVSPAATSEELEEFHRNLFLPLVRRATWKHGLSKEDARDLVQDAFVLAIGKLRPEGNPRAWLTRVVDNLATNLQRKYCRRARLAEIWSLRALLKADPCESIEEDVKGE